MSTNHLQMTIDAAAAGSLLLKPGDSLAIPVTGDRELVERRAMEIEDAIERQYRGACELLPFLAQPDEIGMPVLAASPARGHIIIEHIGPHEDDC